eukprot:58579-Amphidinium_carterae.1
MCIRDRVGAATKRWQLRPGPWSIPGSAQDVCQGVLLCGFADLIRSGKSAKPSHEILVSLFRKGELIASWAVEADPWKALTILPFVFGAFVLLGGACSCHSRHLPCMSWPHALNALCEWSCFGGHEGEVEVGWSSRLSENGVHLV